MNYSIAGVPLEILLGHFLCEHPVLCLQQLLQGGITLSLYIKTGKYIEIHDQVKFKFSLHFEVASVNSMSIPSRCSSARGVSEYSEMFGGPFQFSLPIYNIYI